jgi:hypothetical protein
MMADLKVTFPKPCDELWEDMAPRGCNRHCASCDTIIHDLEHMTLDDVERLLESEAEVCVRARVGPDGVVAIKPSNHGPARRMLAAAGVSLALATAACQTVPDEAEPRFRITGKFPDKEQFYRAELTSADGTKWPKRREPGTGRFIFDNLATGTYTLSTIDNCGQQQGVRTITIGAASVDVGKLEPEFDESCVIVGVMMRR